MVQRPPAGSIPEAPGSYQFKDAHGRVIYVGKAANLRQRLSVQAKGEVAAIAETINNMTDTLATFAEQVTNVAREVGVEGRLGGQANVPGAAGTWRDLTANVNLLASSDPEDLEKLAGMAFFNGIPVRLEPAGVDGNGATGRTERPVVVGS